jgi:hypothetical protein
VLAPVAAGARRSKLDLPSGEPEPVRWQ